MGHVIGIGTLWGLTENTKGVEANPITVPLGIPNPDYDPRFTGAMAVTEYQTLLSAASKPSEADVPIENSGGPGNLNAHWRELTFDNELMSSAAGGSEQLSRLTAASLADIGYTVDMDSATIDAYALPLPASFMQTAPESLEYVENVDFLKAGGASGSASAEVTVVDVKLDSSANPDDPDSDHPANSSSGCEAEDFTGFPEGNIALLQRGACFFTDKVENALTAGASGVIIFNQGNDPDDPARTGLFSFSAGEPGIPVIAIGFDLGTELAGTAGLEVSLDTPVAPSSNLLETAALKPNFEEEILQPIGIMTSKGRIKLFPNQ
jgi:hypothetical protein